MSSDQIGVDEASTIDEPTEGRAVRDPRRIDVFERWERQAALEAFRRSFMGDEQGSMIVSAAVAEYDVAAVRPLS